MQGDNLGVVGFWNGASRIKQAELYTLVSDARKRSLLDMPPIKVVHINRESNRAADYAAGLGAAALLDKLQEGEDLLEPIVFRPINCDMLHEVGEWHLTASRALANLTYDGVRLRETPNFVHLDLVIKLAIHDVKYQKGLRTFLQQSGCHGLALPTQVLYTPISTRFTPFGRCYNYPFGSGGQSLSKPVRCLFPPTNFSMI